MLHEEYRQTIMFEHSEGATMSEIALCEDVNVYYISKLINDPEFVLPDWYRREKGITMEERNRISINLDDPLSAGDSIIRAHEAGRIDRDGIGAIKSRLDNYLLFGGIDEC